MNTKNRKILVIENQEWQFDLILAQLFNYTVFPERLNFVEFIDNVRLWVNSDNGKNNQFSYGSKYGDEALSFILDVIKKKSIELIFMDYILGGAYYCSTGVDLAFAINKARLKPIPIIFISKKEQNEKNREMSYGKYKEAYPNTTEWVHKGYFGEEFLNAEYFKDNIIPKIERLLGQSEEEIFRKALQGVLSLEFPGNLSQKREELSQLQTKKYSDIPNEIKEKIIEVNLTRDLNDL